MAWTLPKPPEVQFIGFSTGWGSVGEFRIWRKVEADESYSEAFTLGVPHSAIPGSERAAASIIGVSAPQPGLGRMGSGSFSFWVLRAACAFGAFSHTPTHLTGKQLPVSSLLGAGARLRGDPKPALWGLKSGGRGRSLPSVG